MTPSCPQCATRLHSLHKSIWAYDWPEGPDGKKPRIPWPGIKEYPDAENLNGPKFHTDFFCPKCRHKFPFTTQEEANAFLAGDQG
jgi:hypothetical protein